MSSARIFSLACLALLVCGPFASPVSAQSGGCFTDMADCFQAAAYWDSFWQRTWQALDCELEFVQCLRFAIFGR